MSVALLLACIKRVLQALGMCGHSRGGRRYDTGSQLNRKRTIVSADDSSVAVTAGGTVSRRASLLFSFLRRWRNSCCGALEDARRNVIETSAMLRHLALVPIVLPSTLFFRFPLFGFEKDEYFGVVSLRIFRFTLIHLVRGWANSARRGNSCIFVYNLVKKYDSRFRINLKQNFTIWFELLRFRLYFKYTFYSVLILGRMACHVYGSTKVFCLVYCKSHTLKEKFWSVQIWFLNPENQIWMARSG